MEHKNWKGNTEHEKTFTLVLALVLALSMCIPAYATEASNGDVLIKTWKNSAGETVTGIISKGSEVRAANTNPAVENEATGFVTGSPSASGTMAQDGDSGVETASEVSDTFYMQIYNSKNTVVSKYKIVISGKITALSKKITSVSISRVSGNTCTTDYSISGATAYVIITHSTEGYLDANFTLNWDGSFTVS